MPDLGERYGENVVSKLSEKLKTLNPEDQPDYTKRIIKFKYSLAVPLQETFDTLEELLSKYLDVINLINADERAGDYKYSYELLLKLPWALSSREQKILTDTNTSYNREERMAASEKEYKEQKTFPERFGYKKPEFKPEFLFSGKSELNYPEYTADKIVRDYAVDPSLVNNRTKMYLLELNKMIQRLDTFNGDKDAYDIINAYTYSTEVLHSDDALLPPSDTIFAKPTDKTTNKGQPIRISNLGQFIKGGKRKSRRLRKKSKNTKRKRVRTRVRR